MTDNEIIKALECCIGWGTCKERQCPMIKECADDLDSVYKYALDLINRQRAEIEELNRELRRAERYLSQIADDWEDWDD